MKKSIVILLALAVTLAMTTFVVIAEHPQAELVLDLSPVADALDVPAVEQENEQMLDEVAEQPEAEIVWEESEVEETLELPVAAPTFRNPAMDRPLDHPGH